jgi:polar amino acid transport system substrate-binding protein
MKTQKMLTLCLFASLLSLGTASCSSGKSLTGFDIDLAKEVGKKLGVNVRFQEIVWEQKEIELSSKAIDLIWNGFTITEERKAALSFTIPYLENKQVVIGKNSFASIDATASYQVAVEAGSAGSDAFDADAAFAKSSKVEVTDQITALTEVLSGTSDLAIIDGVMAGYYLADSSSYGKSLKVVSDYQASSEYYGIGARKGEDALVSKLNEALKTSYDEGTTATIAKQYGLTSALVAPAAFTPSSEIQDTSSWDAIVKKGNLVIGYTVFAPIAYLE